MKLLTIPAGSQVMIGAPAQPMDEKKLDGLRSLLTGIQEITEAHLPQMFVPGGMAAPAQVLVVVFQEGADADAILEKLDIELKKILTEAEYLDIFPQNSGSALLEDVRNSGCRIK